MNVGRNIKIEREKKRITQKELADLLNLSVITIQNYENNRRTPNINKLNNIATALNIPISNLTTNMVNLDNAEIEEQNSIITTYKTLNYKGQIALKQYLKFLQQELEYTIPLTREQESEPSLKEFVSSDTGKALLDLFENSENTLDNKENPTNANKEK